jgi:hypothetical protein
MIVLLRGPRIGGQPQIESRRRYGGPEVVDMRYMVALHTTDLEDDMGGEVEEAVDVTSYVGSIELCEDTRAVARALCKARESQMDWVVFEIVRGKAQLRSIVSKMDGNCLYDVEVV